MILWIKYPIIVLVKYLMILFNKYLMILFNKYLMILFVKISHGLVDKIYHDFSYRKSVDVRKSSAGKRPSNVAAGNQVNIGWLVGAA